MSEWKEQIPFCKGIFNKNGNLAVNPFISAIHLMSISLLHLSAS